MELQRAGRKDIGGNPQSSEMDTLCLGVLAMLPPFAHCE